MNILARVGLWTSAGIGALVFGLAALLIPGLKAGVYQMLAGLIMRGQVIRERVESSRILFTWRSSTES